MIGRISWYSTEKKFGFITAEINDKDYQTRDYFFHLNNIISLTEPKREDRAEFELGQGQDGRIRAIHIKIVE